MNQQHFNLQITPDDVQALWDIGAFVLVPKSGGVTVMATHDIMQRARNHLNPAVSTDEGAELPPAEQTSGNVTIEAESAAIGAEPQQSE